MINYTVESLGHEFHASRNEWNGQEWCPVLAISHMDPVEALRKLIELEQR